MAKKTIKPTPPVRRKPHPSAQTEPDPPYRRDHTKGKWVMTGYGTYTKQTERGPRSVGGLIPPEGAAPYKSVLSDAEIGRILSSRHTPSEPIQQESVNEESTPPRIADVAAHPSQPIDTSSSEPRIHETVEAPHQTAQRGRKPGTHRQVVVQGVTYVSLPFAAKEVGVAHPTMHKWATGKLSAGGVALDVVRDEISKHRFISLQSVELLKNRFKPERGSALATTIPSKSETLAVPEPSPTRDTGSKSK